MCALKLPRSDHDVHAERDEAFGPTRRVSDVIADPNAALPQPYADGRADGRDILRGKAEHLGDDSLIGPHMYGGHEYHRLDEIGRIRGPSDADQVPEQDLADYGFA